MNKTEASQIIELIGSLYTNYNPVNMELAVVGWSSIFADIPYKAVQAALFSYTRENEKFPPTPGQIYSLLQNVTTTDPTEAEAWNMVLAAIKRSTYFAQEEYDKLPEDIQKAIGSPEYLRSLAMTDDPNWSVESSNFYRNYRVIKERKRQTENLPDGARSYIEAMKSKAPVTENKQQAALLEAKEQYEDLAQAAYDKYTVAQPISEPEPTETGESFRESLWKRFGHSFDFVSADDKTQTVFNEEKGAV